MEPMAIEQRLAAIETRLSRLEAGSAPTPVRHAPPPPPLGAVRVSDAPKPHFVLEENQRPGNWLGIIAVICFVLAAGFIVKLSIETGWLTPGRQIVMAALLGFGLIGAGFTLLNTDRAYASLLPGAGVIVLYLTAFAAHRYYELISFEAALAFTTVISAGCIWLYTQIRHDAYAITAAAGVYVAPVLLGLNASSMFSLYYFVLCSVAFAAISVWVRSRTLTLVSSYLAMLMSGVIGLSIGEELTVALLLAAHFLIFSVGTYLYTTHTKEPLGVREAWSFLPVLLIFYAVEYHLISDINEHLAPWMSLIFAGVLIGLYLSAKTYFPDGLGSRALISSFATIVAFHSIYIELLPDALHPWLFVLLMLAFTFGPFNAVSIPRTPLNSLPLYAVLAILVLEYLNILSHLMDSARGQWLLVGLAALASLWVALAKGEEKLAAKPVYGHALLGAAHVLGVVALYELTHETGSLAVSASWLFYGVGVILFAFARKDEVMAKSALFVLAFAAGKALLYDAASAPTIVRIFCLLLTGAVLYGCGLFMRQIGSWNAARPQA
jgi:hypothetical protein